jgi:hypothetical protein
MTEKHVGQEGTTELKSPTEWQLKATDEDEEDSMGDHSNLPMCKKNLQLRRPHKQDQPLEQLDEVIEEIRRLMLKSADTASRGEAEQKRRSSSSTEVATVGGWSEWTAPQICLGPRRIPTTQRGSS